MIRFPPPRYTRTATRSLTHPSPSQTGARAAEFPPKLSRNQIEAARRLMLAKSGMQADRSRGYRRGVR